MIATKRALCLVFASILLLIVMTLWLLAPRLFPQFVISYSPFKFQILEVNLEHEADLDLGMRSLQRYGSSEIIIKNYDEYLPFMQKRFESNYSRKSYERSCAWIIDGLLSDLTDHPDALAEYIAQMLWHPDHQDMIFAIMQQRMFLTFSLKLFWYPKISTAIIDCVEKKGDIKQRIFCVRHLSYANINNPQFINFLEQCLSSTDRSLQLHAMEALRLVGEEGMSCLPRLQQLSTSGIICQYSRMWHAHKQWYQTSDTGLNKITDYRSTIGWEAQFTINIMKLIQDRNEELLLKMLRADDMYNRYLATLICCLHDIRSSAIDQCLATQSNWREKYEFVCEVDCSEIIDFVKRQAKRQ